MALVPCESCRRHVRVTENACPFCKTVRAGVAVVAVATSVFALTGCGETFSPAAKYGGPPDMTTTTVTVPEAGPPEVVSPASKYGGPPMDEATKPDAPDASPRITDSGDAGVPGRKFAPVALYGAPPRRKP